MHIIPKVSIEKHIKYCKDAKNDNIFAKYKSDVTKEEIALAIE